jgi:alpha-glucosidase
VIKKILLNLVLIALMSYQTVTAQTNTIGRLSSPDKITQCDFGLDAGKNLAYRVQYAGKEIISWSALGFVLNGKQVGTDVFLKSRVQRSVNEKFAWRLGESDTITNQYNELVLRFGSKQMLFGIRVRLFNGTVAFRYEIPPQKLPGNNITREKTQFNFPETYTLYQYNQESIFTPVAIDTFNKTCDFPATLTNGKYFISIGEAVNNNYTKAELTRGNQPHSLSIAFVRDSVVEINNSYPMPWRTISISTTAIGLHDFSQLFLKLAEPKEKNIPAWIKPGKLIRAQLNTQSGLDCIDFAVKHQFQYIMFDAGWYGAEFRTTSDPTQVIAAIDMQKVIQYGKEKKIGVILYVNYVGLKAKLDTILPLFKRWGVSGIKFGFVNGLTQEGISWLLSAMQKVNEAGFIFDIHDNYKPTGLSRTFPALLTQEGIRGDENSPDAFHTTVLPFTRFLAGPADFTFCFPNPTNSYSKNLKVSKAQQYALTVIYFSPLQSIFWYGKPGDYTNEAEIEFFDHVPTVWNESRYLAGSIGKNIAVARRSGTGWFVGIAAGPMDWKENIRVDFLDKTRKYTATVYRDDGEGSIRKKKFVVKYGDSVTIDIKAAGGEAWIIEQAK